MPISPSTELLIGGDCFTFEFGQNITDHVVEWFKKYGLTEYGEKIKELGYETFDSLMTLTIADLNLLKLKQEQSQWLLQAIRELKIDIIDGYCKTELIITNNSKNQTYTCGWEG